MAIRIRQLRVGDPQTVPDIAEFFDLPPSFVRQKVARFEGKDVDDTQLIDRFRVERELDNGTIKGSRWAAASLGLKKKSFDACVGNEALSALPVPSGMLAAKHKTAGPDDQRRIFNLKLLADWATKLIEDHLGHTITFANVTSKALKLRDALRAAGMEDADVQFCTFESAHLTELEIDPGIESRRAVTSTLCSLTAEPIWQGYGCWLDNGKPISLPPDLVSYSEVLKNPTLRSVIQSGSYGNFARLVETAGIKNVTH